MPEISLPIVLITHSLPIEWIYSLAEHCTYFTGPTDATELDPALIALLPDAEGLVSLLTIPVTEEILDKASNLRVVSNMAVGVDNIDIKACTKRGIPVGNTPGVLTESTADLTMSLMLSIARNIPQASRDALEGRWKTWSPAGWLGMELHDSILGIVGMGKIGQAVARRSLGFGMTVLFTDPEQVAHPIASQVSFEELLKQSDIISLHAPLTPDTRGMINKSTISMMKPSAILINAARGALIDTSALVDALHNNRIAAVALDVTDPEPLPPSHLLYSFPNCLIVPHIGSATQKTRRRMAELACENLLAGLRGERLPHCVNPDVYNQL
ncbi:MAG: D-glycerate dehydrogenase [Chloroflexi bacterium RBG_16_47_49]|nr:MAG: D-glycerate dehydrogenase [Chloroflexi bacterium RBG_16_47_49]